MIDLYEELEQISSALTAGGVPYALIGGLAVSLYTKPRATKDIDLLLNQADARRAIECLAPLGYRAHEKAVSLAGGRLQLHRLQKLLPGEYLLVDLLLAHDKADLVTLETRVHILGPGGRAGTWTVTREGLRRLKLLRRSRQDEADIAALNEEDES